MDPRRDHMRTILTSMHSWLVCRRSMAAIKRSSTNDHTAKESWGVVASSTVGVGLWRRDTVSVLLARDLLLSRLKRDFCECQVCPLSFVGYAACKRVLCGHWPIGSQDEVFFGSPTLEGASVIPGRGNFRTFNRVRTNIWSIYDCRLFPVRVGVNCASAAFSTNSNT
jgi:hypothetical protein